MSKLSKFRLFQKVATGILAVFMGLMLLVCVVAYARPSGATRQDMSQAQFARLQVQPHAQAIHSEQDRAR